MSITGTGEPVVYNPFDPAFRADPYPALRRLLEERPVHESPLGAWVFARHADCSSILRDGRWSSDATRSLGFQANSEVQARLRRQQELGVARPFLFLDPPDHTRLRGLVQKAFTPRVVEELRPRIQDLVDGLVGAALDRGEMEVIGDLAYPLPVTVISELLGVPAEDSNRFKEWSRDLARSLDPEIILPDEVVERRLQTMLSFNAYFRELIERRRAEPREDLLSALIAAEEAGDRLTEGELLATCILLLVAGHETTVNLIGNGVLALLRHPAELERLRADPSLAKPALEEVLRFDPPVQLTGRVATEDVDIGGVTVEKGHEAILLLAAANRDPAQFPDPDRFDITRADNRHITFGSGIHFCLGAPLARAEGQIALSTLARRCQDLELAGEAPYKENLVLRGLAELPVRFRAAA